jgi:hypothetical protein
MGMRTPVAAQGEALGSLPNRPVTGGVPPLSLLGESSAGISSCCESLFSINAIQRLDVSTGRLSLRVLRESNYSDNVATLRIAVP